MPPFKMQGKKTSEMEPSELASLRNVSKHVQVNITMLRRLEKLGLVEEISGVWSTTQQGHICLMFAAAR
jgi:hypothetical protein